MSLSGDEDGYVEADTFNTPLCLQEGLLGVINDLNQACITSGVSKDLQLPAIVVVGEQSIGKSSVLESITGHDILPRGVGIVTRCPILINLHNVKHGGDQKVVISCVGEYNAEFGVGDTEKIQDHIQYITSILSPDKEIIDKPISVNIFSVNAVPLSFVDLPGITKNPVAGQPSDIEARTKELVISYIQNENTIILAIASAVSDIANSESIKIAREPGIDVNGNRTLVVLTKLDLMDKGTNAMAVLSGEAYPVRLGVVGVKCRSQQDINDKKTIEDVIHDEERFFSENYEDIALKHGTRYLSRRLNKLLMDKISDHLPQIVSAIRKKIRHCNDEVEKFGDPLDEEEILAGAIKFIIDFTDNLNKSIHGNSDIIDSVEIVGGAKLYEKFFGTLPVLLNKLKSGGATTLKKIDHIRKNAMGVVPQAFVPHRTFEVIMKKDIQSLKAPCLLLAEQVEAILQEIIHEVMTANDTAVFAKFPKFIKMVTTVTRGVLSRQMVESKQQISNLIDAEKSFINMNHPDMAAFYRNRNEMKPADDIVDSQLVPTGLKMVENEVVSEQMENGPMYIARMIDAYYEIVDKTVNDQVIKHIYVSMILKTLTNLRKELIARITKDDRAQLKLLFCEKPEIVRKRRECNELLEVLENAIRMISEISDRKVGGYCSGF